MPLPTEHYCDKCGYFHSAPECPECNGALATTSCSSITLNFRGDPNKPHDICQSDYDKLKSAGFLWEFYPDAPDIFPTNDQMFQFPPQNQS